jgi:hypothetical protein
LELI